ncbi:GPR1/FUN34/yaaH family-domain-containing protein [Mucidula mucida]|nr:GPR1/FUN34/yaaH family-domain-containing protein [Mucidula mucida]
MSSTSGTEKAETMAIEDIEANRRCGLAAAPVAKTPPIDASILQVNLPPPRSGLYCFGAACGTISLYNCRASGVTVPNVVVGEALAIGGLGLFVAGLFEFIRGSLYTGTLFLFFTGFWLSYAAILLPNTGIAAAYGNDSDMFGNAVGIYLAMFAFMTVLFLKTIALNVTLVLLFMTFLLLSLANFLGDIAISRAAGVFGVLTAGGAFYIGTGGFLASEPRPLFTLPMGVL